MTILTCLNLQKELSVRDERSDNVNVKKIRYWIIKIDEMVNKKLNYFYLKTLFRINYNYLNCHGYMLYFWK